MLERKVYTPGVGRRKKTNKPQTKITLMESDLPKVYLVADLFGCVKPWELTV